MLDTQAPLNFCLDIIMNGLPSMPSLGQALPHLPPLGISPCLLASQAPPCSCMQAISPGPPPSCSSTCQTPGVQPGALPSLLLLGPYLAIVLTTTWSCVSSTTRLTPCASPCSLIQPWPIKRHCPIPFATSTTPPHSLSPNPSLLAYLLACSL